MFTICHTNETKQLDAAIVRIMKAKRQLNHGALLGEVVRQIQFPATVRTWFNSLLVVADNRNQVQDVKKRVEQLIEK